MPRAKRPRVVDGPLTNVAAVEAVLASLRRDGPFTTEDEAHGRLALTLAAELDAVAAGRRDTCRESDDRAVWSLASGSGTAALAKELRAALAAMDHGGVGDDDDDVFGTDLPATVRDSPQP